MRRGQHESVSLLTGIIIAVLILLSLSFVSCSIAKQQTDVRSRINFDRVAAYLQQCQQYKDKECYCDPPLQLEQYGSGESLSVVTYADGLSLELTNTQQKLSQQKKLSQKNLCLYSYSSKDQRWEKATVLSYSFPLDKSTFLGYFAEDNTLCFFQDAVYSYSTILLEEIVSKFRSCNAPRTSPVLLYLQQRLPKQVLDIRQAAYHGSQFLSASRQPFTPLGRIYTSVIETSHGVPFDQSETVFQRIMPALQQQPQSSLLILSPQLDVVQQSLDKDAIVLSYLKDSAPSQDLARSLLSRLQSLSGKSYSRMVQLTEQDPLYSTNLFSFDVRLEPLDDGKAVSKGLFFFQPWVGKRYPQFFKDRASVPAVFIDFIDYENKYSLLGNSQFLALAQTLFLGVQDYLQQPKPPKTQDVFKP